jgi:hypothetical protein
MSYFYQANVTGVSAISPVGTLPDGDTGWIMISTVLSTNTGYIYLYYNDKLVASNAVNVANVITYDNNSTFFLGGWNNRGTYAPGPICSIKKFIVTKSDIRSDISTLYSAGRNAPVDAISTNGLVLFYDFDYHSRPVGL